MKQAELDVWVEARPVATMMRYDIIDGEWQRININYRLLPERKYAYSIAPKYLSVRIWTLSSLGQRLRSDVFTPCTGMTERQRYEAIAERIKLTGLTPPTFHQ